MGQEGRRAGGQEGRQLLCHDRPLAARRRRLRACRRSYRNHRISGLQELRQQLEAEKRRAAKADELAELYRSGRDQAIDELRALRPQRGHGLER